MLIEYDAALSSIAKIRDKLDEYLKQQRKRLGCSVSNFQIIEIQVFRKIFQLSFQSSFFQSMFNQVFETLSFIVFHETLRIFKKYFFENQYNHDLNIIG